MYTAAVLDTTNYLCFVYRPLRKDVMSPLHFDIDIKTVAKVKVDVQAYIELAKYVAKLIARERGHAVKFAIVCKHTGYFKKINKKDVFCTGCHMYFTNVLCHPDFAERIRRASRVHVPEILGHLNLQNSADDCFDLRLPNRSNGLMMIGAYKTNREGGQYRVSCSGTLEKKVFTNKTMSKVEFFKRFEPAMKELYDPIVASDRTKWVPLPAVVPPTVTLKRPQIPVRNGEVVFGGPQTHNCEINLQAAVAATKGKRPDKEYAQLMMYLASLRYDPSQAARILDPVWDPSGQFPNETRNLIRKYSDGRAIQVTRGSWQRWITNNATQEYDLRVIFPQKKFKYHNESQQFNQPDRVWGHDELNEFFTQVYSFVWGGGKTEFIWREQRKKRFGTKYYTTENVVISDNPPFGSPLTDKLILVSPTLKELVKGLKKLTTQRGRKGNQEQQLGSLNRIVDAKKLLKMYTTLPKDKQYKTVQKFLGEDAPEACEKNIGSLFLKCKQRGLIKQRYHSYTIEPFLTVDRTPSDVLNIFQPFELQRFSQPGEADVKNSHVWRWLKTAWADNDEYKLQWLLCYFASKLQFPWRKVCKFLTCFARLCGCGKTSVRGFTTALYGADKVLFCDTVDDYMSNENSEQKSKLFVIIDDIESCSKKMSLALKSKISNTTFRYKELYKNKITLPDYVDLICTSNSRNPKYLDSDNRRDELVVCNTSLQNISEKMHKFWDKFYAELDDPVLMGKWFHYLSNFDITMNVGSQNCRFDQQALQKHKLLSMKVVHRFVVKFFSDPECFERSCTHTKDVENWFDHVRFETPDGVKTCYISKQRLFDYFTSWKRSAGLKLDTKMSTFCDDLAEIGLVRNRKTLGVRKLTCFTFALPYVRKSLKGFYKVDEIKLPWNWVDEEEFVEYQKNAFRFRTLQKSAWMR